MRLLTVIFHSKIFSKCDSFGEFLSYMEHVMMETPELLNKFEESETETCSKLENGSDPKSIPKSGLETSLPAPLAL